jgi:signal transduction histidine kinase
MMMIGSAVRRPYGPSAAAGFRDVRERVRVFLDPSSTSHRPGRLARAAESWRAFTRTHIRLTDGALALAVLAVGLASDQLAHRSAWAGLLTFLLALPLAWRRRAPVAVFLVVAVAALTQWLAGILVLADVSLLAALYTVAALRPPRVAAAGAVILEGGAVLAAVRWGASALATFAFLSGLVVAALVTGLYVRARRMYVAGLVERAARLEFERDQQALLAAAAERARISREMHDVVAHSLAVVISLANGATAKLGRDPEPSRTGEGAAARAPQPGIEEIADLVHRAAATGLAATLTVRGDPVPVAPGLALSAYRIVQEAITNAVKHAQRATTVTVELAWTPDRLEIAVSDDGRGGPPPAGSASGFGLAGLRERAALYGGTATAGPGPESGWTVTATISLPERAP